MYRFRLGLSKFILPSLWMLLFAVCLLAPFYPEWVAKYYTVGLFRYKTIVLNRLFGWVPFAMGELVYIVFIILLTINIIYYFTSLKLIDSFWQKIRFLLIKFTWLFVKLYVVFQFIWGLNYLQPDPTHAFQLKVIPPANAQIAVAEMNALTLELIQELNQTKSKIDSIQPILLDFSQVIKEVRSAYASSKTFKMQKTGPYPNIKSAIFPNWGDYIVYLAFYQPLTAEAIVRTDLPILTQPYTIAHEMAHQFGYASETEANFIAFVIATESPDLILKYSMLLQMFTYAQEAQLLLIAGNQGYAAWKMQIEKNKALLSPAVLKDRAEIKAFFAARADKQIEASSKLYDQFLKWNQQAAGLASYADVLKWVRAYRLKTGSSTSYSR